MTQAAFELSSRRFQEAVKAFGECGKPSTWGDEYPCNLYWGHSGEHRIRLPDLGWTCGGCWQSGSYMDEFHKHSCGAAGWTNALFALFMGLVAAIVVFALVSR